MPIDAFQRRFEVASPPTHPFEIIQMVLVFPSNTWVPKHYHGGTAYITVLEGAVVLREGDFETSYRAGETFLEHAGTVYDGGNRGAVMARLLATYLLPRGAPFTTLLDDPACVNTHLPAGPTVICESRIGIVQPLVSYDLLHLALDCPVGNSWAAFPRMGQGIATVLDGELDVREHGTATRRKTGETFVLEPGRPLEVGNTGTTAARVVATVLVPSSSRPVDL